MGCNWGCIGWGAAEGMLYYGGSDDHGNGNDWIAPCRFATMSKYLDGKIAIAKKNFLS